MFSHYRFFSDFGSFVAVLLLLGLGAGLAVTLAWFSYGTEVAPLDTVSVGEEGGAVYDTRSDVLGWVPYWDQAAAISTVKNNPDAFTAIGVFWYYLADDGSIALYDSAKEDRKFIDWAHDHGIAVYAVITNLPDAEDRDWDAAIVDRVIGRAAARRRHISDIVSLAVERGFDGVNIDYEALHRNQRADFTRFVQQLARALHNESKVLGVSLHAKPGEGRPDYTNGSEAQDWGRLAKEADELYVMVYDEHWSGSPPGPVASFPWADSIIRYAQNLIPPEKLYIGIPLYGYDWSEDGHVRGLTYSDTEALLTRYSSVARVDEVSGGTMFTYSADGSAHEVWFDDRESMSFRLEHYEELGVRNLAFWRLGNEDPGIWELPFFSR